MKNTLALLALLALLAPVLLWGCVQIIHERPDGTKLKVNTLFKSVEFDRIAYEPNSVTIENYEGIPSDVKLKYNPITGTWEIVAEIAD